jgi:hypothetical protein
MNTKKLLLALSFPVVATAIFWLPRQCAQAEVVEVSDDVAAVHDVDVAGIALPGTLQQGDSTLSLNGSAIRSKWGFKVYVAALYLSSTSDDERHIMTHDKDPKRIHITMLRKVGKKKFVSTIEKNIVVNFSADERKQYSSELAFFLGIFDGGADLIEGTTIDIDHIPGSGTQVSIAGGKPEVILGDGFYHALMRLWIGKPPQASIKHGLLGKKA